MTNFNDTSGIRIEDVSIPTSAYKLLEELAVIKNRTVEQMIEDYILVGLHSDIQNHQSLGMAYANYLREKHRYDIAADGGRRRGEGNGS